MKKAFSLVEMLVVIGILGILIGVLLGVVSGSGDSAQSAKCLANMKNLANAVQSAALAGGYYPGAGSTEVINVKMAGKGVEKEYTERKGWISWNSRDAYPSTSSVMPDTIGMFADRDEALFAITNGAIWKYIGGNTSAYCCPLHLKHARGAHWSYIMNAYFGWSADPSYSYSPMHHGIKYGNFAAADRVVLFAEVPFQGAGGWFPSTESDSGTDTDAILQFDGCNKVGAIAGKGAQNGREHIGANHKSGRIWMAHVVFADGHIEKLRCSKTTGEPLDESEMKKLTTWLCTGKAVTFDGKQYEELK